MNAPVRRLAVRLRETLRGDPWDRNFTRVPHWAQPFRQLSPEAAVFEHIALDRSARSINLLLPSANPFYLSAGPRTAIAFARSLAGSSNCRLQVLTTRTDVPGRRSHAQSLRELAGDGSFAVSHPGRGVLAHASAEDLWIATSWQSALACTVATRAGLIPVDRVVYLIQDYEPAFSAWSTEFAAAQMTYRAGFLHVVNSAPLAAFLRDREGAEVRDDLVFTPALDAARLRQVAEARRPSRPAVFFYNRPIARNMHALASRPCCERPLAAESGGTFWWPGATRRFRTFPPTSEPVTSGDWTTPPTSRS